MDLYDLAVGIGLVFVFEGLMWALFPQNAMQLLEMASKLPMETLRIVGAGAVAFGVAVIWLVRG